MREKERQINRGKEREVDGWRQGRKKRKRRTSLGQKFSSLWVGARKAIFAGKRTRD